MSLELLLRFITPIAASHLPRRKYFIPASMGLWNYAVIDSPNCRCCQGRPEGWRGQFALGPQLKRGGIKNYSKITLSTYRSVNRQNILQRMQDLTISGRWNHQRDKYCHGHPNFPGCCSVYVGLGIFEYQL
jgi:hypothetical protein